MSITVKTGVAIGAVTIAWTLVMGVTGWYLDPTRLWLFFLVVPFEVAWLYWGLRQTAAANTYGRQVLTGTAMAAVAAPIIFAGSLVFTTVVFPNYFADIERVHRQVLEQQGLTAEQVQHQLDAGRATQTPVVNAATGAIATVLTGAIASAFIAIRARKAVSGVR